MRKPFYLTTAIFYANGRPHLGHAYELVLADVIARFRRMRGEEVFFLTGMDEHGQKVQQKARQEELEPQAYVDRIAADFESLCGALSISNNDFIRTTEPRHKDYVRSWLQTMWNTGEIYAGDYQGFYSPRQEQFLQEKDKNEDGSWPEIFGEVEEVTEKAFYFKLSQYQDWLIAFLEQNPNFILPSFRQKQVLEFLKEPLNDLCISRPKERLEWGIPLPFDENYVTYVWFDALVNYCSAVGPVGAWPADYHVIGKDILLPPHAVYWPIMLHASQRELPKHLVVHGWWHIAGAKMSKSLGNIVDPFNLAEQFGPDPLRYFFMREMSVGQDSDFTEQLFLGRYDYDLANDFGNSLNRLLNMGGRFAKGKVPAAVIEEEPERLLRGQWEDARNKALQEFDALAFPRGLEAVWAFLGGLNRYLDQRQPWKTIKSQEAADRDAALTALAYLAESLRLVSTILEPVMPNVCAVVREKIGAPAVDGYSG
ncbi:MAG: class I tRNA ligase family protein, partial [Opitutales bacterium]